AGFSRLGQDQPAVQVALGLLSVTGGALLGAFLLAIYVRRARESDAMWAIGTSAVLMMAVWLSSKGWLPLAVGRRIAWPWYSLIGAAVAVIVGFALSLRRRTAPPPPDADARDRLRRPRAHRTTHPH